MPFIPHTERDVEQMLAAIGADSIEDLFGSTCAVVSSKKFLRE